MRVDFELNTVSPNLRLGLKSKETVILIQSPQNFAKLTTSKVGHNVRMWAWLDQNYNLFFSSLFLGAVAN